MEKKVIDRLLSGKTQKIMHIDQPSVVSNTLSI
jgi:hypothetical protein